MLSPLRLLLAVAVSCGVSFALADVLIAPLGQLGGTWLGGSEGESEYFRLEIDTKGKGVLTVQSMLGDPADAYEILSTSLSGYDISFKVLPIGEAEPIYVHGSANKAGLQLEIGGVSDHWSRKAFLESESDVLSRIDAVTKRAREFRASSHSSAHER